MANTKTTVAAGALVAALATTGATDSGNSLENELIEAAQQANEQVIPPKIEVERESRAEQIKETIADEPESITQAVRDKITAEVEQRLEAEIRAKIMAEPKKYHRSVIICKDVERWNAHFAEAGGLAKEIYGPDKPCSARQSEFEQIGIKLAAAVNAAMIEAKKDQAAIRELSTRTETRQPRRLDKYLRATQ